MENINLNLESKTLEACIKQTYDIGANVYTNICNGQVSEVPWGSMDWVGIVGMGLATVALVWTAWLFIKMIRQ